MRTRWLSLSPTIQRPEKRFRVREIGCGASTQPRSRALGRASRFIGRAYCRIGLALAALLCVGCGTEDAEPEMAAQPIGVMTFNVLCSFCDGSYDPWIERLDYIGDVFKRHDPDLIGVQELTPIGNDVEQILEQAPGYKALYFDGDPIYPDALILYRSERYELKERGDYWLSPTPDKPYTAGFADGAQFNRLVVWGIFEDKTTGDRLYFANTHFDNNTPSQEKSAPLLKERTAPHVDDQPVLVVGDFNSKPDSKAYGILTDATGGFSLKNSHDRSRTVSAESNLTAPPAYPFETHIDHIFTAGAADAWDVEQWTVDQYVYGDDDKFPSDHYPIYARFKPR